MPKRTYQPKKLKRKRRHGFRKRARTKNGSGVLKRRRRKGRKKTFCLKQMLPKKNRLKNKKDFSHVFKSGRTAAKTNSIVFLRFFKSGLGKPQIGVVVGKNCFVKAAERNKMKRLLREASRKSIHLVCPGWKIAVCCKKRKQQNIPKLKDLTKEIGELLSEAGLIIIK